MTRHEYRTALDRAPSIAALWDRMERFSHEFPGFTLVQKSPFLVNDSNRIRKFPVKRLFLVQRDNTGGYDVLWEELYMIAEMLHDHFLNKKQVRLLSKRSKMLRKKINKVSVNASVRQAQIYAETELLH